MPMPIPSSSEVSEEEEDSEEDTAEEVTDAKEAATVVVEDMDGAVKHWRIKLTKEIHKKEEIHTKKYLYIGITL